METSQNTSRESPREVAQLPTRHSTNEVRVVLLSGYTSSVGGIPNSALMTENPSDTISLAPHKQWPSVQKCTATLHRKTRGVIWCCLKRTSSFEPSPRRLSILCTPQRRYWHHPFMQFNRIFYLIWAQSVSLLIIMKIKKRYPALNLYAWYQS